MAVWGRNAGRCRYRVHGFPTGFLEGRSIEEQTFFIGVHNSRHQGAMAGLFLLLVPVSIFLVTQYQVTE